jgi:hypothetical protein
MGANLQQVDEIPRDIFFNEVREVSLIVAKKYLSGEYAEQLALHLATELLSKIYLSRQNYHGKIKFIDSVLAKEHKNEQ